MKRATVMMLLGALPLCMLSVDAAEDPTPTLIEVRTLTRIDSFPTKDEVVFATGNDVVRLRELAMLDTVDFGLQLRAIRTLPHFCTPNCNPNVVTLQNHPAHAAVLAVIASVQDRSGHGILRLRAGIEALGLVRSGVDSDVTLLVPFLEDASRDIRAATARALQNTCNTLAIVPLRARYNAESVAQVRLAISAALRDLGQCSPSS
jgi:hypothetical protein